MLKIIYFIFWYITYLIILPILILFMKIFNKKYDTQLYYYYLNKPFNINHVWVKKEKKIKGFIFSNHRSWFDFPFDNYHCQSSPLGRYLGFFAVFFSSILVYSDNRALMFNRDNVNRKYIYDLCKDRLDNAINNYNHRILVYPEGTRLNYNELNSIEDVKNKFKIGLIKEIYQRKEYPIQIFISSNKEKISNEKKLELGYNLTVKSAMSSSIHPKNFKTFDDFLNKICQEWLNLWRMTHKNNT